jgi:lysophospholipase L1-like esterase
MESFGDAVRRRHVRTLAAFGDSITEGAGGSSPASAWASLLALGLGARLINRGRGGTVLQSTPVRDGRGGSGVSRFRQDLLADDRADCVAILYGYNDARYTGDPARFNVEAFVRDYRIVLGGLLDSGFTRECVCIGSPPYIPDLGLGRGSPGFSGQTRGGFEAYVEAVRSVAAEFGVFYAAVYEAMAREPDGSLASADLVHPNDRGHGLIATAFAAAVR